jgi:hypothetical protein
VGIRDATAELSNPETTPLVIVENFSEILTISSIFTNIAKCVDRKRAPIDNDNTPIIIEVQFY